ncbi:MAG: hypothetical protein MUC88_20715 [Planctomycetes bacterium]|jgi:hypothetical protein|nr:hypothetical protein [Planctomycetota bacterium]
MTAKPATIQDVERELRALQDLSQSFQTSDLDDDDKRAIRDHFQLLDEQFEKFFADNIATGE